MREITLNVNGRAEKVEAQSDDTLLDVLRDQMGLRAAKDGCQPEGYCGACTVIVDGKARVACSQPAERFEAKSIVTLEGLEGAERDAFAHAFAATGASQCGFCSPGIVVKASELLRKKAQPSRDEIARALAGNLCRCTGYVKVIDAIDMAGRILQGEQPPQLDFSGRLGSRTPKYEAFELTLGDKPFIHDITMDGLLHGALSFSQHPRAVVKSIDSSAAAAMVGVVRVVLAEDVPGERAVGAIVADWPVMVAQGETTRCEGDVIAGVVATSRNAARRAAAAVVVDYGY